MVVDLLMQIRKSMSSYDTDPEAVMSAEQNAQVIVNAERYYRAMVRPGPDSWNIRDNHMVDTLNRLMKPAGGAIKNRSCDTSILLKKGSYKLRYITDESHSPKSWDAPKPNSSFYGIKLSYAH